MPLSSATIYLYKALGLANKIIPRYIYNDWIHWEGRWEVIDGHPIAMRPSPIPAYQRVASEMRTERTLAFAKSKMQALPCI